MLAGRFVSLLIVMRNFVFPSQITLLNVSFNETGLRQVFINNSKNESEEKERECTVGMRSVGDQEKES